MRVYLNAGTPNEHSLGSQICVAVLTWGPAPPIPFTSISET